MSAPDGIPELSEFRITCRPKGDWYTMSVTAKDIDDAIEIAETNMPPAYELFRVEEKWEAPGKEPAYFTLDCGVPETWAYEDGNEPMDFDDESDDLC